MQQEAPRIHSFYADATTIDGSLEIPLVQRIEHQGFVKLPEAGGYLTRRSGEFLIGSAVSIKAAYTQVAGNKDLKPGHGWSTLATSVIEGFNVLDVVTADRIVGQVSMEHPQEGYVPRISFLGTRFENLRIAGHPVKLDVDLEAFGEKPAGDGPYASDPGFMEKCSRQHKNIYAQSDLPPELAERYNRFLAFERGGQSPGLVECSLVNSAEGSFPGRRFGHAIRVPDFGLIRLAEVCIEQSDYKQGTGIPEKTLVRLTMIDMQLGCIAHGPLRAGVLTTNGNTKP
jgi:hypothetical protein